MRENQQLAVDMYEDAFIIPQSGCFTWDGNFIPNTFKRKFGKKEWSKCAQLTLDKMQTVPYVDETVIYIGFVRMHYGHFIIDSCGRMWALVDVLSGAQYRICCTAYEHESKDFVVQFFAGLGVDFSRVELINQPKQYSRVLIPELSYLPMIQMNNEYWIKAFDVIISKWNEEISNIDIYKNVYLSQTQYKVSHRYGETIIERIFRKNGYQVIYPEKMSLKVQVVVYSNADEIVCTNGTLAHNGVWMKPQKELVILNRFVEKERNPHQGFINCARNLKVIEIGACWPSSTHDLGCMKITGELKKWLIEKELNYHIWSWAYVVDVIRYVFRLYIYKVSHIKSWHKHRK